MPLETNFYEVYNQPNLFLVDAKATPIERITPISFRASNAEYEFNIIIYAAGFDALTGAFDRIDIGGKGEVMLKDNWVGGARTLVEDFPAEFQVKLAGQRH